MGNSLEHCICLPDCDAELDDSEHQKEQYRQGYCRFDQDSSVLGPAQRWLSGCGHCSRSSVTAGTVVGNPGQGNSGAGAG